MEQKRTRGGVEAVTVLSDGPAIDEAAVAALAAEVAPPGGEGVPWKSFRFVPGAEAALEDEAGGPARPQLAQPAPSHTALTAPPAGSFFRREEEQSQRKYEKHEHLFPAARRAAVVLI